MLFARQISSGALVNWRDEADMGSEEGLVCRDVLLRYYPSSWCEHEQASIATPFMYDAPAFSSAICSRCNLAHV